MKYLLSISAILLILSSCSDENTDCCTNIDTGIDVKYVNSEGENLFEIENGLKESSINIFHKIDGNWVRYYEGNLDAPKGIFIVEKEDGTYLRIFPSTTIVKDDCSETLIEFSENDKDVIKAKFVKSKSSETVIKVWYNDEIMWEQDSNEREFEIVK